MEPALRWSMRMSPLMRRLRPGPMFWAMSVELTLTLPVTSRGNCGLELPWPTKALDATKMAGMFEAWTMNGVALLGAVPCAMPMTRLDPEGRRMLDPDWVVNWLPTYAAPLLRNVPDRLMSPATSRAYAALDLPIATNALLHTTRAFELPLTWTCSGPAGLDVPTPMAFRLSG